MKKRLFYFSLLLFSISSSVYAQSDQTTTEQPPKPILLQILAVNDFHGNLDTIGQFMDPHGTLLEVGGASYLAANLDKAEQEFMAYAKKQEQEGYSIRVQAGDLIGGSPPISSLLQHEPTITAFQKMNFEINALGNHEFDQGFEELKRVIDASTMHPKVKEYTQGFEYLYPGINKNSDFLAANIIYKETQKPLLPGYTVRKFANIPVGFIGTITQETPRVVLQEHTEALIFEDPAEKITLFAKELKDQGVNAVVAVTHTGAYQDDKSHLVSHGSSKQITGESAEIAKNIPPEVGVIVSGHSHTATNGYVEGKYIIQNHKYGQAFGDIWVELDPQTGEFIKDPEKNRVKVRGTIKPNLRSIEPDPELEQLIAHTKEISNKVTNSVIGYAPNENPILDDHPKDESPLGNLITDGMKILTGAQIALTNSGGIRLPLSPSKQGDDYIITWGAAYEVQPFKNMLGIYELDGQAIKAGINQQFQEAKGFIQFSGLQYTYKKTPEGAKWPYEIVSIHLEDGTPLDDQQNYQVAMNKFLAGGGDGYTAFKQGKLLNEHPINDTDTFIDYITQLNEQQQIIAPTIEGRAIEVYDDFSDLYPLLKVFHDTHQIKHKESLASLQEQLKLTLEQEKNQNTEGYKNALEQFEGLVNEQLKNETLSPYAHRAVLENIKYRQANL